MDEKIGFFEQWLKDFDRWTNFLLNLEARLKNDFNQDVIHEMNTNFKETYPEKYEEFTIDEIVDTDSQLFLAIVSDTCTRIYTLCDYLFGVRLEKAEINYLIPKVKSVIDGLSSLTYNTLAVINLTNTLRNLLADLEARAC